MKKMVVTTVLVLSMYATSYYDYRTTKAGLRRGATESGILSSPHHPNTKALWIGTSINAALTLLAQRVVSEEPNPVVRNSWLVVPAVHDTIILRAAIRNSHVCPARGGGCK